MKLSKFIIGVLFCFLFAGQLLAAPSKIDTIYYQNGDRMTGEVKSMESNVLRFSTIAAKTIKILWNNLNKVHIKNPMRINLQNGKILYGRIYPGEEDGYCYVGDSASGGKHMRITDIVAMLPLKEKLLSRTRGTLSAGIDYTKATELFKFDFNGNIQYWSEKSSWEASYNVVKTTQKDVANTKRQNGGLQFNRILPNNWFILGNVSFETNSQLQLDLRTNIGSGVGKNLVYNNRKRVYFGTSIFVNREFTQERVQNNIEGVLTGRYMMYILNSPEVSFNVKADVFPSFNEAGRIRSELDANLRWEIFSDFYLKWTFYNSTDNKPLSGGAVKNDWGITLGLEYIL